MNGIAEGGTITTHDQAEIALTTKHQEKSP